MYYVFRKMLQTISFVLTSPVALTGNRVSRLFQMVFSTERRHPVNTEVNYRKALLSVADVMGTVGLSRTKIYELLRNGELASVTIGRRRMIPAVALENWLARLQADAGSARP